MVLVDANVLLDILTADPVWVAWSQAELMRAAGAGIAVNPIVYAELAPAFQSEKELVAALHGWPLQRLPLPYEGAWPAARPLPRIACGAALAPRRCRISTSARMRRWLASRC